ncbi:MAG: NAD(P)/FAD-dependent oxidoreductase [Acidobacteriota bacterium]
MTRRVLIAGGGLSGLAVATLVARRGRPVEVYDRRIGGGGRFHGGWQIIENATGPGDALEELRGLGLAIDFEVVPARHAVFLDGLGGVREVASAQPYAYFIRRGRDGESLDAALRRQALASGVVLHEGKVAPDIVDVVATGPRQADGVAREVVFTSDLPDTIAVMFDPEVTPTGYAYLFCLHGHATFGVAQVRHVGRLRKAHGEAWQRFREVFGAFAVRDRREGGQYMNFCLPRSLHGADGRWYAGEAAGVQDFLFGLGNRLALRTAALVAAGMDGEWDERRFRDSVLRPMRHTIALRFAYERLGRGAFSRFCRYASRHDLRRLLIGLQRPSAAGLALAAVVMAAWRRRGGCRHAPLCGWCRRSEA